MAKFLTFIFLTFVFNKCNSQASFGIKNVIPSSSFNQSTNGIVYFSTDNGVSWINASEGLPEKISIGLGGIATSNNFLGVATKEAGVFKFNFKLKTWEQIPTEAEIIEANIGSIAFYDETIFVGTQFKGIYFSKDNGKQWTSLNIGLNNKTIRRFCEFDGELYVCTNGGLYSLNKKSNEWNQEFTENGLQANGLTKFKGQLYLATNKGIFKQQTNKSWINSSPEFSMHNISSDVNDLFAMTYNKLLLSSKDGKTWQNQQTGFQKELYTFNVIKHKNSFYAGQWDGVYKKALVSNSWELSSSGLPQNFAVTNLKVFNDILVISTSERKLK